MMILIRYIDHVELAEIEPCKDGTWRVVNRPAKKETHMPLAERVRQINQAQALGLKSCKKIGRAIGLSDSRVWQIKKEM